MKIVDDCLDRLHFQGKTVLCGKVFSFVLLCSGAFDAHNKITFYLPLLAVKESTYTNECLVEFDVKPVHLCD